MAASQLPPLSGNPFGQSWSPLVEQPDRAAALKSYRAATVMLLKRALKNRSVVAPDSLAHRPAETRLIPPALWNRDRGRYLRDLSLPGTADAWLDRLSVALRAGMVRLDEAIGAGLVTVDETGVHLPRRKPAPKDPAVSSARRALASRFGTHHLADIMVEIDGYTQFSSVILGRRARSEDELITVYVALMALGSGLSAATLDRMVPDIEAGALSTMIERIEAFPRLPAANDASSVSCASIGSPGFGGKASTPRPT